MRPAASTGSALVPAGKVEFYNNSHELGSVTLAPDSSNSFAAATFGTSTLGVGVQRIRTVYSGDANYRKASGTISETVQAATATTLTATADPAGLGQPVTFVAHVAYAATTLRGTPALFGFQGEVEFLDGTTPLSTPVRVNGSGVAKFTTSSLAEGTHNITAEFEGGGLAAPSTSSVLAETILAVSTTTVTAATTLQLVSSANPAVFGQEVDFTATVNPVAPVTGTAGGLVVFSLDGTSVAEPLVNGSAVLKTSRLTVAGSPHTITALYPGNAAFSASPAATLAQVIDQAQTHATLTGPQNGTLGQPLVFQVEVDAQSPGTGLPTGTVTFMDGSSTLGTAMLTPSPTATVGGSFAVFSDTQGLGIGTYQIPGNLRRRLQFRRQHFEHLEREHHGGCHVHFLDLVRQPRGDRPNGHVHGDRLPARRFA